MAENVSDGNSKMHLVKCSNLKKGDYVMLKGHLCKIVDVCSFKSRRYDHIRVHIFGKDTTTGYKYDDTLPCTQEVEVQK